MMMVNHYSMLLAACLLPLVAAKLRGEAVANLERILQTAGEACTVSDQTCTASDGPRPLCTPFRSPEFCGPDNSFPTLISNRYAFVQNNKAALAQEGWWFPNLDDKLAGYVYSALGGFNPPKIYLASLDVMGALDEFATSSDTAATNGFVIRATHLHSNKGVYALPNGFGGMELIRGFNMTLEDIKVDLADVGATKIIIEQFIPGDDQGRLPTEYKFHVFQGEIGAVNVFHGRGSECGGCWAEIDENRARLDQYGCFTPGGSERKNGECNAIDFATGAKRLHPIKGVDICSDVPDIEPCIYQDMINIAKNISLEVGVYIRVDMFVDALGGIHVQEFSTNHLGGLRHCSARLDEITGCVDSCFMGRLWQLESSNTTLGGSLQPVPEQLVDLLAITNEAERSALAVATPIAPSLISTTCPASGECIPPLNTQFANVTVTFIGEPPDNVPQFVFDFLNEQFEGAYNFLNTEGSSDGVDTCDPLFRRVLSVESELGEIVTAERRRRLDDVGGGFGTFSFNFNIGWGCNGFCPNDNPLFGNDAGRRRQLEKEDEQYEQKHRQLQDIFGVEECVCPARAELRAPTENEFTIELNKRLATPVTAPVPPAPSAPPSGSSQPSAMPTGSHFPTMSQAPTPAPAPSAPFITSPPVFNTEEPSVAPTTLSAIPDVFSFGVAQGTTEN